MSTHTRRAFLVRARAAAVAAGTISHRLGRGMPAAKIAANGWLAERFAPFREHLERNGEDLSRPGLALGPGLEMAPRTERFTNNPSANNLLSRPYRSPYVVPQI